MRILGYFLIGCVMGILTEDRKAWQSLAVTLMMVAALMLVTEY